MMFFIKYLKYLILYLSLLTIVFTACKKNNDQLPVVQNEIETIQEIQSALNHFFENDLLINRTADKEFNGFKYKVVYIENGDSIFFKSGHVLNINEAPALWNITFRFTDSTIADYGFIGDSLYFKTLELNPSNQAPLVALAKLNMPVAGKFKVEVLGKGTNGVPISHRFENFQKEHQLPILGLYANHNNQVKISFLSEANQLRYSQTYAIQTSGLAYQPEIEIIENSLPSQDDHIYFVTDRSFGFDQLGEVRWAFEGDHANLYRKTKNGNFIIASGDNMYAYHSDSFYEVSVLGDIIKEYEIPNFLHHEVLELPNGNYLVGSNSSPVDFVDGLPEEDLIVEIDRNSGAVVKTWDLNLILDPQRPTFPTSRLDDWFHLNAIQYDESDQSIVISGRHQSTVAKIDYTTSAVQWILSNPNFWKVELQDKLLNPVDANNNPIDASELDFWTAGQHTPLRLPNGNYLIYDNGIYRNYYYDSEAPKTSYTRVVEYNIDEPNKTVQLVSEFKYKEINTLSTGDVDYLEDTQGLLIAFMNKTSNSNIASTPKIVQLSANKQVVFEANVDVGREVSRNYYRAERMRLYEGLE